MPYDETLAQRIRNIFYQKDIPFTEKKMMGGLVFMMNDKMCCGIRIHKEYNDSLIMARIGDLSIDEEIEKGLCIPMKFTGKPMKGFVFVLPDGYATEKALHQWIERCVDFNPHAQSSKKKK